MFGRKKKKNKKREIGDQNAEDVVETAQITQHGVSMSIDEDAFLTVKTGNSSHPGAREYQEDSFGWSAIFDGDIVSEKGFVAVLADGMGGLESGAEVSGYVVSSFITMFDAIYHNAPFPPQLESIAMKINDEICKNFIKDNKSGAGSTLVAAFVYKAKLYWLCIGDSRLYLLRNGMMYVANEDHDYFNQLLSDNLSNSMSIEEISADVQKDRLTSYIGSEELKYIDANKIGFSLRKGDTIILCSDGIYNGITDAEIIRLLGEYEPQKASEEIAAAVLSKNIAGQDNLTIMVIKFE